MQRGTQEREVRAMAPLRDAAPHRVAFLDSRIGGVLGGSRPDMHTPRRESHVDRDIRQHGRTVEAVVHGRLSWQRAAGTSA